MSSINTCFIQAELSLAAYGTFSIGSIDPNQLTNPDVGMSPAQAAVFAATYTVVDQYTDPSSGFSATVFEHAGQRYLAIRGTEKGSLLDYVADADLALSGAATKQIVSLFNYVHRLNGTKVQPVAQLEGNGQDYILNQTGAVGLLDAPLSGSLSITGHSLGGHLAMAFGRLFPQMASQIYTYNAPGFINTGADNLFARIDAALGRSGSIFAAAATTNLYGSGLNVIAGYANDHGTPQEVFLEGNAHSIIDITDSLAIYNLLANLDSSLADAGPTDLAIIGNILKASSNVANRSLENTLDAVRKIFDPNATTPTLTDDREDFYKNLYASGAANSCFAYTLRDLSAYTATQIAIVAESNIAYRYALVNGNSFALVGDDTLYDAHNANGELNLYDPAAGQGSLTSEYLADRATWLAGQLAANTQDQSIDVSGTTAAWDERIGAETNYQNTTEVGTSNTLYQGDKTINLFGMGDQTVTPVDYMRQIKFGAGQTDTLTGGNKDDRLYGMAGDDTLQGNGGNDYLEGGQGDDTYLWNSGDGLDTLRDTDGLGSIQINGQTLGAGETRDGGRTYTHTDAAGTQHSYTVLSGDINSAEGATLLIDDAVKILNYHAGELGLTLGEAAPLPPNPILLGADSATYNGADTLNSNTASEMHGGLGNDILIASAEADLLYGDEGHDAMFGGGGNDELHGGLGNDLLNGGQGDDLLYGEAGNDLLVGQIGNDVLYGADGNDYLFAGATFSTARIVQNVNDSNYPSATAINAPGFEGFVSMVNGVAVPELNGAYFVGEVVSYNYLDGGAGDDNLWGDSGIDTLMGSAGADMLYGFSGNDVLLGGADNDVLHGDVTQGDLSVVDAYGQTGEVYALPELHGDDYLDGGAGDDTLVGDGGNDTLLGGDGNDILYGDSSKLAAQWHGNDVLDGGAGDDTLVGNGGDDILLGGTGVDQLWGGDGNDTLEGGSGDDVLYGDNGNGGAGDDTLVGGDGNDTLWGEGGNDTLIGDAGDDKLYGAEGANYLDGGDGNDLLNTGGSGNTLVGGAGDDTLEAAGGNNYLDGGDGIDTLVATGGNNSLYGGLGNDDLQAAGGNNYLDGEEGDNTLFADGGSNTLVAGNGSDTLAAHGGNNYLNGSDGSNLVVTNGLGGNTLMAGSGDDTLSAEGGNNILNAGDGNNTLVATGGFNTLTAGSGDDMLQAEGGGNSLFGGAGADTLYVRMGGDNLLDGGEGRDLYVFDAGFGVSHIADSGGLGNSLQFNFDFAGSGIVVGLGSLKLSFATGDELHIDNYDPNDPTGSCVIDTFVFNDRTLSLQEILDLGGPAVDFTQGPDIIGTDFADILTGTDKAEHIYGLAGNDTIDGGAGADTLVGGYGNDIYIVDNAGDAVVELAGQGWDEVRSSVSYTLGAQLESLVLTGTDNINGTGNYRESHIVGNEGDNVLSAGGGAVNWLLGQGGNDTLIGAYGEDHLDGGAGADVMVGWNGDDSYFVDDAGDTITENVNEGYDQVYSSISYTLGANIERLMLTGVDDINGVGNGLDNWIDGNDGNNILQGGGGNDRLDGGLGADTMAGGTGSDTYIVQDAGDIVVEAVNAGTDQVSSYVDYSLTDNVENLNLMGTAATGVGNALNNVISGNLGSNSARINYRLYGGAGNDSLTGNYGNDYLDGGTGADSMTGRLGNDTYVVDSTGDRVIENLNGGIDTILSSITYTLGYQQENLTLTGSANINGTGNELSNILIGNDGDNVLIDPSWGNDILDGGAGADIMSGGYYSDTYYVDNVGDQVIETDANIYTGGNDQVYSLVSFSLGANVENLTLTGTNQIDGTGNELNNKLVGNEADNILTGGAGNDIYIVQNSGDVVVEEAGGGVDKVYAYSDFTLSGNTEYLYLYEGAITGTGDDSDNYIEGGVSDNTLYGMAGNDNLNGRGGNDTIFGGDGDDYIYGGWDEYVRDENWNWSLATNNDYLDGGGGNDNIDGGAGNDTIIGGDGHDTLYGGDDDGGEGSGPWQNDDVIDGGAGDDQIDGGSGADRIFGGAGNDVIYGGNNRSWNAEYFDPISDSYLPMSNDDYVDGGDGNDEIYGQDGHDQLLGGAGDDWIEGGSGDDTIIGGSGNDELYGDDGNDVLYGTRMEDVGLVYATVSAALDYMEGGSGDDTYIVGGTYIKVDDWVVNECGDLVPVKALQWETDEVIEYADQGYDVVQSFSSFTLGANIEELQLIFNPAAATDAQYVSDMMQYGQDGAGNELDNAIIGNELNNRLDGGAGADYLDGGTGNDTYVVDQLGDVIVEEANGGIDTVESSISYSLSGTNLENLTLLDGAQAGEGNAGDNIITGNSGYNELYGGAGEDTLIANGGGDSLYGGAGDDRYVFRPGDGEVWIFDSEGLDTLFIGGDLTIADVETARSGDDLVLTVAGTPDQVVIVNWFTQAEGIGRLEFCDTPALDRAAMEALLNAPPIANDDFIETAEDFAQTIIAVSTLLSNDTDADVGDVISLHSFDSVTANGNSVSRDANGDLVFNLVNDYQSLRAGQTATDSFTYTISDVAGEMSTATVTISITGTNDAPVVAADVNAVQEEVTLTATGNVLANDSDIDLGTVLQVANAGVFVGQYGTLTLNADGGYEYVLDNASYGVQSLAQGQVVTDTFDYEATDGIASTPSTLTVSITGTNDVPMVVADVNAVQEDVTLTATGNVLVNDSDIDQGTVLQVANAGVFVGQYGTLTLNADGGYEYVLDNASYGVQSLAEGQVVTDVFDYAATDGIASTPSTLTVSITGTNDAPVVAVPLTDACTLEDQPFSYQVSAGTFTDIDQGDVLSYSATLADGTALPDWVKFDAATQTFSGLPSNWNVGLLNVSVTATDLHGATATSTFSLDIQNVNDAPIVVAHLADQQVAHGKRFSIVVPATTFDDWDIVHGDSLSYSATLANGEELPKWLKFDAATRTFSGKAEGSDKLSILLTATDQAGASVTQAFTLSTAKDEHDKKCDEEHDQSTIIDTTQDEIIVSSSQNDIIHTGNGADSIVFGRGDGQDTVYGGEGTDNTLILTDGIGMADIALSKHGNDLVLETGATDQLTFRNWYDTTANYKSVLTLDIISSAVNEFDCKSKSDHPEINTTFDQYDFGAVVAVFDQAWAADSTTQRWNAAQSLAAAHVDDGEDAALGSPAFNEVGIASLLALRQTQDALQLQEHA